MGSLPAVLDLGCIRRSNTERDGSDTCRLVVFAGDATCLLVTYVRWPSRSDHVWPMKLT